MPRYKVVGRSANESRVEYAAALVDSAVREGPRGCRQVAGLVCEANDASGGWCLCDRGGRGDEDGEEDGVEEKERFEAVEAAVRVPSSTVSAAHEQVPPSTAATSRGEQEELARWVGQQPLTLLDWDSLSSAVHSYRRPSRRTRLARPTCATSFRLRHPLPLLQPINLVLARAFALKRCIQRHYATTAVLVRPSDRRPTLALVLNHPLLRPRPNPPLVPLASFSSQSHAHDPAEPLDACAGD